jgi:glycerate kinase
MRVLIAPDKFRGTATAVETAEALAAGIADEGHRAVAVPLADGGEDTLEALGGATEVSMLTGPLGTSVPAQWRLRSGRAVVETPRASGLELRRAAAWSTSSPPSAGTGPWATRCAAFAPRHTTTCSQGSTWLAPGRSEPRAERSGA